MAKKYEHTRFNNCYGEDCQKNVKTPKSNSDIICNETATSRTRAGNERPRTWENAHGRASGGASGGAAADGSSHQQPGTHAGVGRHLPSSGGTPLANTGNGPRTVPAGGEKSLLWGCAVTNLRETDPSSKNLNVHRLPP